MKSKKAKQVVVNKLRRGLVVADVYVSYDTRFASRVSTPEEFMGLATGRSVDRLSWTDEWMQVCLD